MEDDNPGEDRTSVPTTDGLFDCNEEVGMAVFSTLMT